MSQETDTITIVVTTLGALAAAERQVCEQALARHGSIYAAAAALGVDRHTFKRRLIKHRIPHRAMRGPTATGR